MLKDTRKEFDKVWEKVKFTDEEVERLTNLLDELKPEIDQSHAEWIDTMKPDFNEPLVDHLVDERLKILEASVLRLLDLDGRIYELEKVCASISQQLAEKKPGRPSKKDVPNTTTVAGLDEADRRP